jgi:TonB family protein
MHRSLCFLPVLFISAAALADTVRVDLPQAAQTSGAWHLSPLSVDLPPGATAPAFVSSPQPTRLRDGRLGVVSVSFEINETGLPVNVQVYQSSNKELEDEVIAFIRELRFRAASRGDVPVASHGSMTLTLGPRGEIPHRKK